MEEAQDQANQQFKAKADIIGMNNPALIPYAHKAAVASKRAGNMMDAGYFTKMEQNLLRKGPKSRNIAKGK